MRFERTILQPEVWALHWSSSGQPLTLRRENIEQLHAHLQAAQSDAQCKAVILRSQDTTDFCLGMDLDAETSNELAQSTAATFGRCLHLLRNGSFVSIAFVEGNARGGGVGLAAACDFVVATRPASFALPEVSWSMIPALIWPSLLQRLSSQRARWLALSAEAISAESAHQIGLIDSVANDHNAGWAEIRSHLRMVLRADREAIARTKALADGAMHRGSAQLETFVLQAAIANFSRPELEQARLAFANGESPPWSVRLQRFECP
jgi:enoyl-CoA hydratase/carnithine racemase